MTLGRKGEASSTVVPIIYETPFHGLSTVKYMKITNNKYQIRTVVLNSRSADHIENPSPQIHQSLAY